MYKDIETLKSMIENAYGENKAATFYQLILEKQVSLEDFEILLCWFNQYCKK